MKRIACLALLALAAAGCEHPFGDAGLRVPAPVPGAPPLLGAATAADAEQAVIASATLQALLRQMEASPLAASAFSAPVAESDEAPRASASWLEAQSSTLRALMERAESARRAGDAADVHLSPG